MSEPPVLCTPENRLCTHSMPPPRPSCCGHRASAPGQIGFYCTREAGHPGPHVACGSKHNCAAWNDDGTPYEGPLAYGNEEE